MASSKMLRTVRHIKTASIADELRRAATNTHYPHDKRTLSRLHATQAQHTKLDS